MKGIFQPGRREVGRGAKRGVTCLKLPGDRPHLLALKRPMWRNSFGQRSATGLAVPTYQPKKHHTAASWERRPSPIDPSHASPLAIWSPDGYRHDSIDTDKVSGL